jgi:hypothetical protein
VACDDVLINDQMIDVAAEALGRSQAMRVILPVPLFRPLAPIMKRVIERSSSAIRRILANLKLAAISDPFPKRKIFFDCPCRIGRLGQRL